MDYEFDWDDAKAAANVVKHGVPFIEAMTVFSDSLAITFYDTAHSLDEERWVTIGETSHAQLIVVIHTFVETGAASALVRLISARPATKNELRQYRDGLTQ